MRFPVLHCLIVFFFACGSCQPRPESDNVFDARFMDLSIHFPSTIGELRKKHNVALMRDGIFWENRDSIRIEWYYDRFHADISPYLEKGLVDATPLYGVAVYVKGTTTTRLIKQVNQAFKVRLKPIERKYTDNFDGSDFFSDTPSWAASLSDDTFIAVRQASIPKGDFWYPTATKEMETNNVVRLAIGFDLTPDQAERFAISRGLIRAEVD